jgi:hypothetical protein
LHGDKIAMQIIKGHTMSTAHLMKEVVTLAQYELGAYQRQCLIPPTPPHEPAPPICQPGDTECVKRLIEAFSDCE